MAIITIDATPEQARLISAYIHRGAVEDRKFWTRPDGVFDGSREFEQNIDAVQVIGLKIVAQALEADE